MPDNTPAINEISLNKNAEPISKLAELQQQLDDILQKNMEFAKAEIYVSGGQSNQKIMRWFDITKESPMSDESKIFINLSASVQATPATVDTRNLSDLSLSLNQALDPKNNLTVSTPAGYMVGTRLQVIRNGPVGNCDYTLKVVTKTNERKSDAAERLLELVSGITHIPESNQFVYVYDALKLQQTKIHRDS